MRTIVYNRYGSADVLELDQMPIPEVGPDEVLIENYATSVNPVDWKFRRGDARLMMGGHFPRVPGSDIAGVVREVGADVRRFKGGERVFAHVSALQGGAYAEYVAVKANHVATMPSNLNFAEAAAVPLAGLTAYQGLMDKGDMGSDFEILVNGASGGVGTLAVQIARAYGATVTGVCSTRHVELVRSLGADRVMDYTREDPLLQPGRFDLIYDVAGTYSFTALKPLLKPGGTAVSTAPKPGNFFFSAAALFMKESFHVVWVRSSGHDLQALGHLIERDEVRPVVDRTFELEEAAAAHRYSEGEHSTGKIILLIHPDAAAPRRLESTGAAAL
ncbi:MAG: NAD(P)-dependent alcohol dehydrogenase [Catalinimonas sp.]